MQELQIPQYHMVPEHIGMDPRASWVWPNLPLLPYHKIPYHKTILGGLVINNRAWVSYFSSGHWFALHMWYPKFTPHCTCVHTHTVTKMQVLIGERGLGLFLALLRGNFSLCLGYHVRCWVFNWSWLHLSEASAVTAVRSLWPTFYNFNISLVFRNSQTYSFAILLHIFFLGRQYVQLLNQSYFGSNPDLNQFI